ncbi:MAG: hypothetical protein LBC44_03065 [Mycoplasmataceae bacterium]|jgi:hypothetical protein|nr:hypothetical protein [Mycoplasmataceae bacterium]
MCYFWEDSLVFITFILGLDTRSALINNTHYENYDLEVFYLYHTVLWHTLLVLLFCHFFIFRREMYSGFKVNLISSLALFGFNVLVFWLSCLYKSANFTYPFFILYNHDGIEPFWSLCKENLFLQNFLFFVLGSVLFQVFYTGYYYLSKICRKLKLGALE